MQLNSLHTIIHSLLHFVKLKQKIFYKKTEKKTKIRTNKKKKQLGEVFVHVLEDAGVYKCKEEGREAY